MSAVQAAACACGSIGAPETIRRCDEHWTYWLGDRRMESVSRVIKTLCPADYSKVDPIVLEVARLRGQFVDTYFSEWLQDPHGVEHPGRVHRIIADQFPRDHEENAADTVCRIMALMDWWKASGLKATAVQKTVFSESEGIAGTFDLATEDTIIDLKCVSKLQPNYSLQLGAYLQMESDDWLNKGAAILHVTKEKVRLVKYDPMRCLAQWRSAVNWYSTLKELTK
jgi:hypothetical protein